MRTVSPEQSTPFIIAFDTALKRGLERILGAHLDCKWWRQAQLPLKYGGMGLRSGKSRYGAQHFVSLIKWSAAITTCITEFNGPALALEKCGRCLSTALEHNITTEEAGRMIEKINCAIQNATTLSLAQLCELFEHNRIN